MGSLNIIQFLNQYNIPYILSGKNVRKGNVNINCPLCREDPSYHMGVDLTTGYYGCWRSSKHRGKDFAKIVQILIQCSPQEAQRLIHAHTLVEEHEFKDLLDNLWKEPAEEKKLGGVEVLELRKEFKYIHDKGFSLRFWRYLEERGFDSIDRLVSKYHLHYCLAGDWKYRIIFPIYFECKLVSWVGRSIQDGALLKYKDLAIDESVRYVKSCLYNYDNLVKGGSILFVCEGVFDCLKLDFYLKNDCKATCLFTKTMTREQVYLLNTLSKKFNEVRILLDSDAMLQGYNIVGELSFLKNVKFQSLPVGVKDPGELSLDFVQKIV